MLDADNHTSKDRTSSKKESFSKRYFRYFVEALTPPSKNGSDKMDAQMLWALQTRGVAIWFPAVL